MHGESEEGSRPLRSPWRLGGLHPKDLALGVARRFSHDRIADQAAKLAYFFLLSLFPLLFFLTSVLGLVLRRGENLRQMLDEFLSSVMPTSAWDLVQATLAEISQGADGVKLSVALAATIWTASRGMAALIQGLNVAYDIHQYRRWWRRNLLAIGLTLAFTAAVIVALPLLLYSARAAEWAAAQFGLRELAVTAWSVGEKLIALALVLMAFNLLYHVGPNVKNRRWHWLMPGTVIGVGLWLLASYGFQLYLSYFDRYSATYGSIGAVIVLMLWFYLSGIAVLVGGAVNSEIEKAARRGEAPVPKDDEDAP